MKEETAEPTIFLKQIREIEFSIREPSEYIQTTFNPENLFIEFSHKFNYNDKNNVFSVDFLIKYNYKINEKDSLELLHIGNQFDYEVTNVDLLLLKRNDESYQIPEQLLFTLFGTIYSTMRGIIAVKTMQHFVNKYYLPLIDPATLIKKQNITTTQKVAGKKNETVKGKKNNPN